MVWSQDPAHDDSVYWQHVRPSYWHADWVWGHHQPLARIYYRAWKCMFINIYPVKLHTAEKIAFHKHLQAQFLILFLLI